MISVVDVSKSYGTMAVLRGVTLAVADGETVLLAGPNGAGKSTLLRAIAGLQPPSTGSVHVSGQPPATLLGRPGGVGCLLQTDNVAESLSVRDNLLLAGWHLPGRERAGRVEELLGQLGPLTGKESRPGGLLSGGERQCLALAMALVPRPAVLLLDEPTAGLSPAAGSEVMEMVAAACSTVGCAVLVEHRLDLAIPVSSRIVGLNGGRIVWESLDPGSAFTDRTHLESLYFSAE